MYACSCLDIMPKNKIPGESCLKNNCGCNGCDLRGLMQQGCPKLSEPNSFPYLDVTALTEGERKSLLYLLETEKNEMIHELVRLRFCFVNWIEKNVPLNKLQSITNTILGTAGSKTTCISDTAESHEKYTDMIWKYITWFDCSLLKNIVDHSCEQLKLSNSVFCDFHNTFQKYEEKRVKYCAKNIFECPNLLTSEQNAESMPGTILCLKVDDGKQSLRSMTNIECFLGKLIVLFEIKNMILYYVPLVKAAWNWCSYFHFLCMR